ncbi:hypothetical protein HerbRD11066_22550 [Herbidospora sp. RD11066]
MPRHDRKGALEVAREVVLVAVADARGLDPHEHLFGPRRIEIEIAHHERRPYLFQQRSSHLTPSLYVRPIAVNVDVTNVRVNSFETFDSTQPGRDGRLIEDGKVAACYTAPKLS